MPSQKFIGYIVGIIGVAAYRIEYSTIQPENIDIEYNDVVIVVGID